MNKDIYAQVDREMVARLGLKEFVRLAWHQVEPANAFMSGWHLDAISDHLQNVAFGNISRLVINQPPGSSKSLMCSVFFPAWLWTFKPATKWIFASYASNISKRDNLRARRLIDSPWYQERWGHVFRPNPDEWGVLRYSNDQAGVRIGTSVGATVVGEHANIQVVDDPVKPADVTGYIQHDAMQLDKIWEWWSSTMATRLVNKDAARIIVMQRLGENDLTGRVLDEGNYEHLMLPMLFEKKRRCKTSIGFSDPRQEEDELLWPDRFPIEAIQQRQKEMGARSWAAQDQQRPAPAGGALFQRSWMSNWWTAQPKPMYLIQSWDTTMEAKETADYAVGQIWGHYRRGQEDEYYLVDQVRAKMGFLENEAAILSLCAKYPTARDVIIERTANGPALVASIKKKKPNLHFPEVKIAGKDKIYRANGTVPLWAEGKVFLPHPDRAPWVHDFIEEMASFPQSKHDDTVDAASQAIRYLTESRTSIYRRAIQKS